MDRLGALIWPTKEGESHVGRMVTVLPPGFHHQGHQNTASGIMFHLMLYRDCSHLSPVVAELDTDPQVARSHHDEPDTAWVWSDPKICISNEFPELLMPLVP